MPASQVTMILIAGWTLSLSGNTHLQVKKPVYAVTILLMSMLFAIATLVFAATEVPQLQERTSYSKNHSLTVPRFWQEGRVCEYNY
jgi:hypothetical protein